MAKDLFHNTVKVALQKDGWHITHDPYQLRSGILDVYIDLAAEEAIAAEKAGRKIAVEVKSFAGSSTISEFHTAHGCGMHLDIIEGQIWIQHNSTEIYIDQELIQRGVSPKDIILGFRSPDVRKLLAGDRN